jgi:hypothetical protein
MGVIVCAIAGSAGMSPRVILPVMATVITINTAQRLKQRLVERRSASSLQNYAVALGLIAASALAACAMGFVIAGLGRHLTLLLLS